MTKCKCSTVGTDKRLASMPNSYTVVTHIDIVGEVNVFFTLSQGGPTRTTELQSAQPRRLDGLIGVTRLYTMKTNLKMIPVLVAYENMLQNVLHTDYSRHSNQQLQLTLPPETQHCRQCHYCGRTRVS